MFEFAKQQVKLVKASTPMENHGKDLVMAVVLTVEAVFPNTMLRHFGAGLREALYRKGEEDENDLATDPDALTSLRYPKMSPFEWDIEGSGYTAIVEYGIGGPSNIELGDVKAGSYKITPLEGGVFSAVFNITCHPDDMESGRLCRMQKQNIDMTLTAPEPTTVQELFPAE